MIGDPSRKNYRKRAGSQTVRVLFDTVVNVADKKTGKVVQAKLQSVSENAADPNFVRRNIMTKEPLWKTRGLYESPADPVVTASSMASC